ncbi:hypothetical protein AAFC00_003204 [Neodothiora populina]|uniref:Cytochrome P450 6A1 n=1 Tax=Neodothiora populina TaxID=2781224 RepID=A0ABR3P9N7_9PEZI
MAILSLVPGVEALTASQPSVLTVLSVFFGLCAAYLYLRPAFVRPKGAPPLLKEDWPIIGTLRFFTGRWDFFQEAIAASNTGSFSFHVGSKHVVGVSGDEARKTFFEAKDLDFLEGYANLLAGSPSPPKEAGKEEAAEGAAIDSSDPKWFLIRILAFVKGDVIRKDTRKSMEILAADDRGVTDPFDSIYKIVYQLTMRTVACKEIAEDPAMLEKTLHLYEEVEKAATPTVVMYPWLPSPAKLKRVWGGAQLYMIFKKIVDDRRSTGHRVDDALQFCMDAGDDIKSIITFVLGALFAGQLNSGINAAWVLIYLSQSPEWQARAREEVESVAAKYDADDSKPLYERLSSVPAEAWESEFKVLELCLRDSIRIQMVGAAFRKNISGKPVKVGDTLVPDGSCAMYHTGNVHLDPEIYPEPLRWNPGRYLDQPENKGKPHTFIGWGVGRHPCPGQRFAKVESNLITAFFLAYFDFEYSDSKGNTKDVKPPPVDLNGHSAHKPKAPCYLKYKLREANVSPSLRESAA